MGRGGARRSAAVSGRCPPAPRRARARPRLSAGPRIGACERERRTRSRRPASDVTIVQLGGQGRRRRARAAGGRGVSNCRAAARGGAGARPFEPAWEYFSFIPPRTPGASLSEGVAPFSQLGRLRHCQSPRCGPRLWVRPCLPGSSVLRVAGAGRQGCCLPLAFLTRSVQRTSSEV